MRPRARKAARVQPARLSHPARSTRVLAPLTLVAAALWAYHNMFRNPFVFDDYRFDFRPVPPSIRIVQPRSQPGFGVRMLL